MNLSLVVRPHMAQTCPAFPVHTHEAVAPVRADGCKMEDDLNAYLNRNLERGLLSIEGLVTYCHVGISTGIFVVVVVVCRDRTYKKKRSKDQRGIIQA